MLLSAITATFRVGIKPWHPRRRYPDAVRIAAPFAQQQGPITVPKPKTEAVERIVEELLEGQLSKAERMRRLRELAQSGDEVPDELMDQALRKLMERITG